MAKRRLAQASCDRGSSRFDIVLAGPPARYLRGERSYAGEGSESMSILCGSQSSGEERDERAMDLEGREEAKQ
jgi:hypothetical protein